MSKHRIVQALEDFKAGKLDIGQVQMLIAQNLNDRMAQHVAVQDKQALRIEMAGRAMQGLLAGGDQTLRLDDFAHEAVRLADALIEKLGV